jgi:hypothetical protein
MDGFYRTYGTLAGDALLGALVRRTANAGALSWQDRGYRAGVQPLELWLGAYVRHNPGGTRADVLAASADGRQAAYRWLLRPSRRRQQDRRIQTLLEQGAFARLHRRRADAEPHLDVRRLRRRPLLRHLDVRTLNVGT